MSFIVELKRRNAFFVGAAYVVLGWLLIELRRFNLAQGNGRDESSFHRIVD